MLPGLNNCLQGKRVLIAEDNPMSMAVVKRFCLKWGMEVAAVSNGQDVLARFERNKYDLLLLDLEMPERDGYSTMEEIRKLDQTIPIAAFTASDFSINPEALLKRGFSGYIPKPVLPEHLRSMIMHLTNSIK